MPELPEVETVRTGLAPVLEHHRFTRVVTRRGDLRLPFPSHFAQRLTGRDVHRLYRRAKYLLAELDGGETLVIHLGMSGRLSVYAQGRERRLGKYVYEPPPAAAGRGPHDHVIMETDAPAEIVFTDHRRFGLMLLLDTTGLPDHPLFKGLGAEPLSKEFTTGYLRSVLKGRRTPIKSALLDQRTVAGLGNIYVCEALFQAGVSPKRAASKIDEARAGALVRAIRAVLRAAIKSGGSSLRDYAKTDGALGEFQHRFAVYDREGAPCPRRDCKGTVKRIVQGGRSTFYCPACQR
ncbi:MAG TPA: bifunctional DNA-formamidopyrimidine glycosylase/DNA-(apurinic or apyrimidinic site) lyase [Rhizomicrobium sp.]|jgi:formamidopyrimidine-DNA glycosylase|nr:bifunctional DNA-formamidopyrimidine glycosylase/DNA-(apurinic or apyrimidinic site) lyase [Rhizomicrobium sp.]